MLDAPRAPNKRQPPGTYANIARLPYESAVSEIALAVLDRLGADIRDGPRVGNEDIKLSRALLLKDVDGTATHSCTLLLLPACSSLCPDPEPLMWHAQQVGFSGWTLLHAQVSHLFMLKTYTSAVLYAH